MMKRILFTLITVLFVAQPLFAAAPPKARKRPALPEKWVDPKMSRELEDALSLSDFATVKQLIDANQDLVNARNDGGFTPLMLAILNNDEYTAEFLLKQPKIRIDRRNNMGQTALDLARFPGKQKFRGLIQEKTNGNSSAAAS